MRTAHLPWISLLVLAIAAGGCKKKDDASADESAEKDTKAAKKKAKADDDEKGDEDEGGEKKKKKKGDDDDDGKAAKGSAKAGGPLTAKLEGEEVVFKYGRTSGFGSLRVELSNEKLKCRGGTPSDDAYTLSFELPSGPGGTFYAGYPIGVPVMYNHQRIKLKSSFVRPQFVKLQLDPFKLKEGEHLKGSLSFDHKYVETKGDDKKDWKYSAAGDFDIEICEDRFNDYKKANVPLAADAPEGDVGGTFAGEKFKAKTVLAIVMKDFSSKKYYVDAIEFYGVDGVDCQNHWTEGRKASYFYLTDIGGGSETTKFEGTKQPAQPWFAMPKGKGTAPTLKSFGYTGGRRAWVKLDNLDFEKGSKIKGTVFAESAPDAKAEDKGTIGGSFEAKVCNSW
jgi:hypothetical protein